MELTHNPANSSLDRFCEDSIPCRLLPIFLSLLCERTSLRFPTCLNLRFSHNLPTEVVVDSTVDTGPVNGIQSLWLIGKTEVAKC